MRSPPRLNIRRGRCQMAELPALPPCLFRSGVGGLDYPLEHRVVSDECGCPPQEHRWKASSARGSSIPPAASAVIIGPQLLHERTDSPLPTHRRKGDSSKSCLHSRVFPSPAEQPAPDVLQLPLQVHSGGQSSIGELTAALGVRRRQIRRRCRKLATD